MRHTNLDKELQFALRAARRAGDIALQWYQTDVTVETKSDASPVTVADRTAEQELRGLIAAEFPDDGILGEEFGEKPGKSGRRWILDPVDGTKSFIHGVPLWGVLVALEDRGKAVVGVIHMPALDETAYAARGAGAWWLPSRRRNDTPVRARTSAVTDLKSSLLLATGVEYFERGGHLPVYERLRRAVKLERGWGDCYAHLLVATGRAEVCVEPLMSIWDCAALLPVVMEAGGTFGDWAGDFTHAGGNAICTNGKVYEQVLRVVNSG